MTAVQLPRCLQTSLRPPLPGGHDTSQLAQSDASHLIGSGVDERRVYMTALSGADRWPELPYAAWKDTRDTLHLWTHVVGKIGLTLTPWLNHLLHLALSVPARGLTTSPIAWHGGRFQIDFDFIDHVIWVRLRDGRFPQ